MMRLGWARSGSLAGHRNPPLKHRQNKHINMVIIASTQSQSSAFAINRCDGHPQHNNTEFVVCHWSSRQDIPAPPFISTERV